MGPVVWEYVFGLARPIQAEVTPGAPEAPGARDERLRISTRDPLRERDPPSKFAAPDSLHLSRDVGDRPEEDQPNHAPIAGAGRVVEHLVGAGGVPGKDDTAVAALDGKEVGRASCRERVSGVRVGGGCWTQAEDRTQGEVMW